MADEDRYETAARIRQELGLIHSSGEAYSSEMFAQARDWADRCIFGDIWARPGLDLKNRSRITIAMLTALRAHEQLATHVRAGLNLGLTKEEIVEILMHATVYCGAPASMSAMLVAERVFAAEPQP